MRESDFVSLPGSGEQDEFGWKKESPGRVLKVTCWHRLETYKHDIKCCPFADTKAGESSEQEQRHEGCKMTGGD